MYFPTPPSFVIFDSWNAKSRANLAMNFMEDFTKNGIDDLSYRTGTAYSDWYIDHQTLQKANGEYIHGGKKSWEEGRGSTYGPFAAHLHDPILVMC